VAQRNVSWWRCASTSGRGRLRASGQRPSAARKPRHRQVSTMPARVPAAAVSPDRRRDSDEHLVRAEVVSVGAATRRLVIHVAVDGSDELPLVHARDCNPHHTTVDSPPTGCQQTSTVAAILSELRYFCPFSCDDAWQSLEHRRRGSGQNGGDKTMITVYSGTWSVSPDRHGG